MAIMKPIAVIKPTLICAAIALGTLIPGRGISSAIWETQSGTPTEYAPFSIPRRKTKPFGYPKSAVQSLHTKALLAWPEPALVLGITAQTMTVMETPPRMKNSPALLTAGRALLAKRTMQQQDQVMIRYTTNWRLLLSTQSCLDA